MRDPASPARRAAAALASLAAAAAAAAAAAGCGDQLAGPPADAAPVADTGLWPDDAPPDAPGPAAPLELAGAIAPVHDPVIIQTDTGYALFATGTGIRVHTSVDLRNWSLAGQVFADKPAWITTTGAGNPNDLWAPDISFFGGAYHLYYSASRFGSNTSCIGHATTPSLQPAAWTDRGAVLCSTGSDDWNAIDPNLILDEQGAPWLAFGSFWSGLKLVALDAEGARVDGPRYALSARANSAVEAPFVIRRGAYWYLFQSVDHCCQGAASTYKTLVGRAAQLQGPYVDRDGEALLAGGGTLVLEGDARWRGPGHNAILRTPSGDYNVYHSYDAEAAGIPTLRIAELAWSADGWPSSPGP